MFTDWQQFGLKRNPFDITPLVEGSDLSIEDVFVGRTREQRILDNLFSQEERLCLIVSGDVGVGKTSFVNRQKYIWKYKTQKLLFSSRREIEMNSQLLSKKQFILEILGSVVREIQLRDERVLKTSLLKKIQTVVDIYQEASFSGGFSVAGYGGMSLRKSNSLAKPIEIPLSVLEGYLSDLVEFLKSKEIGGFKYSGLIVHVNNFGELLSGQEKAVRDFFLEIRDLLQMQGVYYIFIGPQDFYEKIVLKSQRLKHVFHDRPMMLRPLSALQVYETLIRRIEQLKSDDVQDLVKPFNKAFIISLYTLFQSNVRSIMQALNDVFKEQNLLLIKTLTTDEGLFLLQRSRWRSIQDEINLTAEQMRVLKILIEENHPLTVQDWASLSEKESKYFASQYIKRFRESGIIEHVETKNDHKYWWLTSRYIILAKQSHKKKTTQ